MATPKRTNSGTTYAQLERAARIDCAARVLQDPLAPVEHLSEARRVLTSANASAPTLDLGEWIKGLPAPLLFEFRDLFRRIAAHKAAPSDDATTDTTKPAE